MACELNEILPRDLEPTHYRIKIIPNLKTLDISGVVRITFIVKNETNKIIFNLSNIIIVEESVKITQKENSKSIEIKSQNYMECCLYEIALNNPLKVEEEYFLDLAYSGELNKSLQGFYKMTYLDNFDDVRTGASTQFSPTDARKAFPCFDEPHFKATFRISIARPSDMKTLSNMILEKSEPIIGSDNYVWDHYPETPKMPTYIVGFMITTLKTTSNLDNLIRVWCRGILLGLTDFATDLAPKILNYLEDYFDIKFPLPKMDLVAVPEFGFSAMENYGMITFRENVLLCNKNASIDEKKKSALVMGHEIAHQWFGNLVTPSTWNDLWLKEGFATYFEYLSVDKVANFENVNPANL
ncbi:unnamed protein product [Brassicogethes aeneus]|uniref:Aminopeptidase N n=1 Tax=Brassicogethes aeneus TaxID=1431903 RepID=A0A9P0FMZ3_BRAAE|nr:unnamed protein product [Brassicogethes aeneus]